MKALQLCIILLTIAFVSCNKKTQTTNSRNDSVEKYLKLASIDSLPIEARKTYNKKAFSFIDLERNDTMVRWYLFKTTECFIEAKDSFNYYSLSNLHYKKSLKVNDTLNLARFYRFRGSYHRKNTKHLDSSFYYYLKSEKLFLKTDDKIGLAKVYMYFGEIQNDYSDYLGAEYSYIKALKLLKDTNKYLYLSHIFNGLGNVNHNIKNYYKAIKYHQEALIFIKKDPKRMYKDESVSLNNIGNSYRELKNFDSAIFYFKKAIEFNIKDKKNIIVDPYSYNNLAYCYLNSNDYSQLPFLFDKATKMFDSLGIIDEAAINRIYLSNFYVRKKDTAKAIVYAEKALQLAKESKNNYYHLYALSNAGSVNKKKAPIYIKEYHRLNDSLLFEERKARNQFFKIQLETDEITQEKEKAIKQKWVQTSIIATVLLIVILLFIIFKQRSQKKEFVLIQNQQKANEEIYQLMLNQQAKEEEAKQKEKKRIALELHDNVMNKLASTRFNLFTLTQKNDDPTLENAVQHIDKIKDIEDEIRNITHELSKETFSKSNSFTSLLAQLIEQQNQLHPTDFNLEIDPKINWDSIASEIKMNYYRIIQEALHNTNKYAKATKSTVSLLLEENKLRLSISDNGVGFETNTTKQGIGIQNMQQRITAINGEITINSALGKGTVINCSVEI